MRIGCGIAETGMGYVVSGGMVGRHDMVAGMGTGHYRLWYSGGNVASSRGVVRVNKPPTFVRARVVRDHGGVR